MLGLEVEGEMIVRCLSIALFPGMDTPVWSRGYKSMGGDFGRARRYTDVLEYTRSGHREPPPERSFVSLGFDATQRWNCGSFLKGFSVFLLGLVC